MHGCTFNIIPKGGAMSAKNDSELVERVKTVASSLDGIGIYEDLIKITRWITYFSK